LNHGDTESTEKNKRLDGTAHGPSMPSEYDKTDCSYFAALIEILSFSVLSVSPWLIRFRKIATCER